ncbi:DUF4345 domain-containing protein [Micromonospora sp. LOL_024]|uniref:DUF4345 domain-containing protein n=1 Tax=Micromonospora sp. LOL_024 TaxID=3345412 RepID=UPI003A88ACDA
MSRIQKATLLIAGFALAGIGAATLLAPESFHSTNGIDLGGDSSLLSEARAAGGALLSLGVLIMAGAFVARLTFTSSLSGALVHLSYAFARLLSLVLDGRPATGLILAAAVELLLGLACVAVLRRTAPAGAGA